ncbi:hypothetical protein DNH61_25640 [Paenibacillus sambharensis]|uniref:Uncharacterized protein n=1 Tax=Paenibacillus sambharensis TaxID=1803190 RepID=A0A2W1LF18_9BACL|nr:DUF6143 family protein [Paenibacillus sambharensis]PZD92984.1 hypothetical protein DNH61_25640 [Paenibacillus sambharensis]
MPNYKVFNEFTDPLAIVDPPLQASQDGAFFTVSTGPVSVAANGFLALQLIVPANVSRTVYIARFLGGSSVNTTIDFFFNATFAATGTTLAVVNGNAGISRASNTSSRFITQTTDPTTGGARLNSIIQPGGPLVVELDGRFIVPSGPAARTFYVRMANNTNQTNLLAANISFWEAPSSGTS